MLTVLGVDYAWGAVPFDALKRSGARFAMRYVSHDAGKDLSGSELHGLWARGISVGLIFESMANRAAQGFNAGLADAEFADARAKALGLAGIPIYFAVDFPASGGQVDGYFRGVAHALGKARAGVYGSYDVVKYLHDRGIVGWFWQTYAWSRGLVFPNAHILQFRNGVNIGGLDCDLNHATNAGDFGVRGPHAPKPVDPRIAKWQRRLAAIRRAAQLVGWTKQLRGYADKLKAAIRAAGGKA